VNDPLYQAAVFAGFWSGLGLIAFGIAIGVSLLVKGGAACKTCGRPAS
jgi:hypothetical protein